MNNKQLQLVIFEQAKKLKAAGFDWPCEYAYHKDGGFCAVGKCDAWNHYGRENSSLPNGYSAPTVALALKWLREVKGLQCEAYVCRLANGMIGGYIHKPSGCYGLYKIISGYFDTYDRAESVMLDKLLKLLENEKES